MTYRNIAAAALAAAIAGASANAAGPPIVVEGAPQPTRIVGYGDLNLSTEAGRSALDARVRSAARDLCIDPRVKGLREATEGHSCMTFALDGARGQIDQAVADFGTTRYARREGIRLAVR